jgi:hypothetical protein
MEVFASELIAEFYQKNPAAPRQICKMDFGNIPCQPIPSLIALSLEEGGCKGTLFF